MREIHEVRRPERAGRPPGLALVLAFLTSLVAAWLAWAPALAAGGKPATKLVNVADTRSLTGLSRWVADIYNTNLWLYSALVVAVMVGMGLALGFLSDRLIARMGINLGKLEHHE